MNLASKIMHKIPFADKAGSKFANFISFDWKINKEVFVTKFILMSFTLKS